MNNQGASPPRYGAARALFCVASFQNIPDVGANYSRRFNFPLKSLQNTKIIRIFAACVKNAKLSQERLFFSERIKESTIIKCN